MRIDIVTVFPDYLRPLELSIVGRARADGLLDVEVHDLRDWATDRHRSVDDTPYGGGPGMVMRADVWGRALDSVLTDDAHLVVPTPAGRPLTQAMAAEFAHTGQPMVVACGRYEGIDSRVVDFYRRSHRVTEVCVADVVVAGGEVAALLMVEAVARLLPGVLGNDESAADDSFAPDRSGGALEGPVYTRPRVWRGLEVPPVLLSGNHAEVAKWRAQTSRERTEAVRPELLRAPGDTGACLPHHAV